MLTTATPAMPENGGISAPVVQASGRTITPQTSPLQGLGRESNTGKSRAGMTVLIILRVYEAFILILG